MASPPRTATVVTHLRCNQNCTWCDRRRPTDDPAFIRGEAVRARASQELRRGVREIVFTGGEPTMRRDLVALVAHARDAGAERVSLETNATLLDGAAAAALAAAGLGLARVNLSGDSEALDAVTRDPGGFRRTLDGLRALHQAGVAIEIVAAVVRSTEPLLPGLPALLAAELPERAVGAIEVVVPVEAPDPTELLSFEAAARVVQALEAAARARGIPVRMSPGSAIPPCVFPPRSRLEHLYSFTSGRTREPGHTQLPPCADCRLGETCSGIPDAYLRRHPPPPMHPIREERARRRLSMVGTVPEQIAREMVAHALYTDQNGQTCVEDLIRINFHCNQSCTFCFVSTHLPAPPDDKVAEAIHDAARRGARIVLSGGEPTLSPRLVEWLRLARSVGARAPLGLQTNAVRLDDRARVDALVEAGLENAFVSLHGATAEVSDAVTEAPGTFARTLVGIDNLSAAGVDLTLNFVVCQLNLHQPPELVRMVAARWPRARINFSFVAASTDLVPRDRRLIPRYSDVLPKLGEATLEAKRLNVPLVGFESMCGLPLCLVPPAIELPPLPEVPPGFDQGEFVRAPACEGCRHLGTCYGVRRGYAELYGTDEMRTIQ